MSLVAIPLNVKIFTLDNVHQYQCINDIVSQLPTLLASVKKMKDLSLPRAKKKLTSHIQFRYSLFLNRMNTCFCLLCGPVNDCSVRLCLFLGLRFFLVELLLSSGVSFAQGSNTVLPVRITNHTG